MEHILIIDSDRRSMFQLNEMLTEIGYQCDFLTSPGYLFQRLAGKAYDLIFIDTELAEGDAISLLQEIKKDERFHLIPVIITTKSSKGIQSSVCFKLGAADYLKKPFDKAELKARVRNILMAKRYKDQLDQTNRQLKEKLKQETTRRRRVEKEFDHFQEAVPLWKQLPEEVQSTLELLLEKFGSEVIQLDSQLQDSLISMTTTFGRQLNNFINLAQKSHYTDVEQQQAKIEFLQKIPLFETLNTFDLMLIADRMEEAMAAPGVQLLTQDQAADGVYFIKKGTVAIEINNELVAHRSKGDSLGEMSCLRNEINASATVKVIEPSVIWKIHRDDFMDVIERLPKLWQTVFHETTDRFHEISRRKSELFQHSTNGLVKIDRNSLITDEFSTRCVEIFEEEQLIGQAFHEMILPSKEEQDGWNCMYPLLFENTQVDFDSIADLLPKEILLPDKEENDRFYQLSYYPCRKSNNEIEAVDVSIRDITDKKELAKRQAALEKEKAVMEKIYDDPDAYLNMLELCKETMEKLNDFELALETSDWQEKLETSIVGLMRTLHTLKGISGLFQLDLMKNVSHELETTLKPIADKQPELFLVKHFQLYKERLEERCDYANGLMNNISGELKKRLTGIVMSREDFKNIKLAVSGQDIKTVRDMLANMEQLPIRKLFQKWPEEVSRQSEVLDKQVRFSLNGDSFSIPKPLFRQLENPLVHILRNCLDHGLETTEQRMELGKDEWGTIAVFFRKEKNNLFLEISDDGQGMDFKKIIAKAKEHPTLNQDLVQEYIAEGNPWKILLMPGFSTAKEVTDLSGRGVGMDVIKNTIKQLHGTIQIESEQGEGSQFLLEIPL